MKSVLRRDWSLCCHKAYLVEIEDQIEFADVVEIFVEHFHKVVDRFQVGQVVVCDVDADAEIQPSVTSIDDLEITKLKQDRLPYSSFSLACICTDPYTAYTMRGS